VTTDYGPCALSLGAAELELVRSMKRVIIPVFFVLTALTLAEPPPPVGPHGERARKVATFARSPRFQPKHARDISVALAFVSFTSDPMAQ
jgi:hypothetical protein